MSSKQLGAIMSGITEEDFKTIITSVEGFVDYEYFVIILMELYCRRATDLIQEGWYDAANKYKCKAEKLLTHLETFRALNRSTKVE